MGKFAELFLGMARQSENDGTFVTNKQIAKTVNATGELNSRGNPYSDKPNQGSAGLWATEVKDAYNEGRTSDGDLLQYSFQNKR